MKPTQPKKQAAARPNRKPKKARSARRNGNNVPRVQLSPCARDYARSIVNPFTTPPTCIPSSPAIYSLKAKVFSRGVFSTSTTNGFGWIAVEPFAAPSNQPKYVAYTDGSYTLNTISTAGATVGVAYATSNSNFNTAAFGTTTATATFRIVSCGLRIRYAGTELNRGGSAIAFVDPTHSDNTGRGYADVLAELGAVRLPIDRQWKTIVYRPVLTKEYEYGHTLTDVRNSIFMLFIVQAPTLDSSVYEYEAYTNFEVNGVNVRGMTPTHIDPVGIAGVQTASVSSTSMLARTGDDVVHEKRFLNEVASYLSRATTTVSHVIQDVGTLYNAAKPAVELGAAVLGL